MADDDQGAGPVVDHRGELRASGTVEIVRRFVEQRDRSAPQGEPGDRDEHRLTSRHLGDSAVEVIGAEPDPVESLRGTGLDVPVVADGLEVDLVDFAGFDGPQRGERAVDAEELGHGRLRGECEGLGQIADVARGVDASGGRSEQSGDQPEQRGLAGAVAADEAGSALGERPVDVRQGDGAVRPCEGEITQGDGRILGCRHVETTRFVERRRGGPGRGWKESIGHTARRAVDRRPFVHRTVVCPPGFGGLDILDRKQLHDQ